MTAGSVLFVAAILCAAALLYYLKKGINRQEEQAKKVRSTQLYGHVYPFLRKYDDPSLESVIFRPESITIHTVIPLGGKATYTYAKHQLDDPSQDTLFALAQAAMLDMRVLRNNRNYIFKTHSGITPSGTRYNWYSYTIRPAWKDHIIRSEARKNAEDPQGARNMM